MSIPGDAGVVKLENPLVLNGAGLFTPHLQAQLSSWDTVNVQ